MARERKLPPGMSKRGRTFYARFRAGGRLVQKKLSSDYGAACTMLNALRARADRADFGLRDDNCNLAELGERFISWKKKTSRVGAEYERDVKQFLKLCPAKTVAQLSAETVEQFRDARLAEGVCPRTVNKQLGVIRHMVAKGMDWGATATNPLSGIAPLAHDNPTKRRRALSVKEVQALLGASPDYLRPVWLTLLTTGLRKDELVQLTFADFDERQRTLTVQAAVAKNHKAREIELDDTVFATIVRLREQAPHRQPVKGLTANATAQQAATFTKDHIFVTKANTPLRNNLLTRFYSCCARAGIADAKPGGAVDLHACRVSFCTLALENGASPKAVQEILGHSTLNLTMGIYAKATAKAKRDAVNALPFATASSPAHVVQRPVFTVCSTDSEDRATA